MSVNRFKTPNTKTTIAINPKSSLFKNLVNIEIRTREAKATPTVETDVHFTPFKILFPNCIKFLYKISLNSSKA